VDTDSNSDLAEFVLDLVRVDNSGKVSACNNFSSEVESSLLNSGLGEGTEDFVKSSEGISGEDAESSEVTTWGKLQKVESVHVASVNSWQVTGGSLDEWVLISVNKKRSLSEDEAGASVFSLTGSASLLLDSSEGIFVGTEFGEGGEKSLGGFEVEGVNNKRELWDGIDCVSSGLDEWDASGGSECGGNGVSLLGDIDLSVPFSPGLERSEHATFTAHVTESGLSGSVGTRSTNSWDSSDSASSSP